MKKERKRAHQDTKFMADNFDFISFLKMENFQLFMAHI